MYAIETERTVTILRPVGTSIIHLCELEDEDADPVEAARTEHIDEEIDEIRDTVEHIAEELRLKLQIYEYNIQPSLGIPSRIASKWIGETNVIATIDPTDEQLSYIMTCMRQNPVMSMLLTYSDSSFIEDRLEYISTQATYLFGQNGEKQSRVFVNPSSSRNTTV